MLFKPYLVEPILNGSKIETRRLWKRRMVRVNGIYYAKTDFRKESIFARIKILYVKREKLGGITNDGVRKEGCRSIEEFQKIWTDVYGNWDPDTDVFVVGFRVI